jgi:hypothetical protein
MSVTLIRCYCWFDFETIATGRSQIWGLPINWELHGNYKILQKQSMQKLELRPRPSFLKRVIIIFLPSPGPITSSTAHSSE